MAPMIILNRVSRMCLSSSVANRKWPFRGAKNSSPKNASERNRRYKRDSPDVPFARNIIHGKNSGRNTVEFRREFQG